jgi:hypothetical protein
MRAETVLQRCQWNIRKVTESNWLNYGPQSCNNICCLNFMNFSGYYICYTFKHSGHSGYLRVLYVDLKATEMISLHNINFLFTTEVECLLRGRNWHFSFNYSSCFSLKVSYKRQIRYLTSKGEWILKFLGKSSLRVMFGYRRNEAVEGWRRECVMRNCFVPFTEYWEYYDDMIKLTR